MEQFLRILLFMVVPFGLATAAAAQEADPSEAAHQRANDAYRAGNYTAALSD